ncbi:MAG: C39 family peptidase [Anaerolineales bacterium]
MKHQKQWDLAPKLVILVGLCILVAMLAQTAIVAHAGQAVGAPPPPNSPYFTSTTTTLANGLSVDKYSINGPSKRPAAFAAEGAAAILPATAKTLTVPAFDWVFGCSSVSASMIAGYYDRNGYPNIYTGPGNGGVIPLDNSTVWGTWSDGVDTYPDNPLIASHNGVDGRTINGSIDDYWIEYGSSAPDPYITGSWTQHTWGTSIGDYMKTSQSAYGNTDGSTNFYTWTTSAAQLTCADMVSNSIDTLDGTYGRKLFYQARGYTVTDCFNQKTDDNGGGFTFALYKAQIDAGHPVLLNLAGHSIVGVGYDDAANTVYVHDTWDHVNHSMTWGGSYAGMQLLSVSVVNLKSLSVVPTPQLPTGTITTLLPTYQWTKVAGATQYRYQLYKGTALVYTKVVTSAACATACTNKPTTALTYAAYKWHVQALVGGVWGTYSAYKTFTVAKASAKPKAGLWGNGSWNSFYVTANQASVSKFAIVISVSGCGTYKISRTVLSSIVSNKFSFTGSFYATGTFTTTLAAHGTTGLSSFPISGCGNVSTGGAVAWSSTWRSAAQPTVATLDTAPVIIEPALPGTDAITVEQIEP